LNRKLKVEHKILLNALTQTDKSAYVLTHFSSYRNPVLRMLEAFAELKIQGLVDDRDKGEHVSWTLTEKARTLL